MGSHLVAAAILLLLFPITYSIEDCSSLRRQGRISENGNYRVRVKDTEVNLSCHIDDGSGEGWTIIQKRDNGDEPFWNRTWSEYKKGFGDAQGSAYWLSLDIIHQIAASNSTLRIEIWGDRVPGSAHATDYWWTDYTFAMGDETTNYTARFYYAWWAPIGNATTGWYDLTCNDNVPFSTIDRIHDPSPQCVTDYHLGGWWLRNCAFAALNGEYIPPKEYGNGYGMMWIVDGLYTINPKRTRMLIKTHSSR